MSDNTLMDTIHESKHFLVCHVRDWRDIQPLSINTTIYERSTIDITFAINDIIRTESPGVAPFLTHTVLPQSDDDLSVHVYIYSRDLEPLSVARRVLSEIADISYLQPEQKYHGEFIISFSLDSTNNQLIMECVDYVRMFQGIDIIDAVTYTEGEATIVEVTVIANSDIFYSLVREFIGTGRDYILIDESTNIINTAHVTTSSYPTQRYDVISIL